MPDSAANANIVSFGQMSPLVQLRDEIGGAGDLSNGPPSVDSSLVCGPIFSDVCFRQWLQTAHLSQLRAPLNKHMQHGHANL